MNTYHAVIYSWTCIVPGEDLNKIYIGQTREERLRYSEFLNMNQRYSGKKLEAIRVKYGKDGFRYKILREFEDNNLEKLQEQINRWEVYYINKYEAVKKGLNTQSGGGKYFRNIFTEIYEKEIIETNENIVYKINLADLSRIFSWGYDYYNLKKCSKKLNIVNYGDEKKNYIIGLAKGNILEVMTGNKYILSERFKEIQRLYGIKSLIRENGSSIKGVGGSKSIIKVMYEDSGDKIKDYKFYSSLKEAAIDNKISYSTMHNYYKKSTNGYMPAVDFIRLYLNKEFNLNIF